MLVVILDASESEVVILRVDDEEEIWKLGYKETECTWMEIQDVTQVLTAVTTFMYEEGSGV